MFSALLDLYDALKPTSFFLYVVHDIDSQDSLTSDPAPSAIIRFLGTIFFPSNCAFFYLTHADTGLVCSSLTMPPCSASDGCRLDSGSSLFFHICAGPPGISQVSRSCVLSFFPSTTHLFFILVRPRADLIDSVPRADFHTCIHRWL